MPESAIRRVTVALIMPVRNEEDSVARTLDAVFASTRLPDEIIIADGMSEDRTVERIESYRGRGVPLRVVANPSRYAGGGRNRGIDDTACDVILLADFGNVLDSRWMEEMVRPFEERDDVDMVAGMFRPLVTSDFEHCVAAIHYFDDYVLDRYSPAEKEALLPPVLLPGALSLAITRSLWARVGGFPEWLAKAQDKLFSRKAHGLGARVAVSWNASVLHHVRRTPAQVFKQLFFYGRGNGQSRYVDKHVVKLLGVYGTLAAVAAASVAAPALWFVAFVLGGAYGYRAGWRKVRAASPEWKWAYAWMVPLVLVPRDLGTIFGHVVGWAEWFLAPEYRRRFRAYMQGCDRRALAVVAR